MDKRESVKRIKGALENVTKSSAAGSDTFYGRGLRHEGYEGGYAAALRDVLLLLQSDTVPNTRGFLRENPSSK